MKEHIALMEIVVRKTEQLLAEREIKLHADRILHLKETKTLRAQEISRFAICPVVGHGGRYQVLNMIGKGGFSEVFKGYDLINQTFVAVKIHEIKRDMTESTKR
jgi:tousled-like kinase